MKLKFSFLVLLFFAACTHKKNFKNKTVAKIRQDVSDKNDLQAKAMMFVSSQKGFVGGSINSVISNPDKTNNKFAFLYECAVLFNTKDGGETWERMEFGSGQIMDIQQFNGELFLLKQYRDYNIDTGNFTTEVYMSSDTGNSWKKIHNIEDYVTNFTIYNDMQFAVFPSPLGMYGELYNYIESTKTWQKVAVKNGISETKLVCHGAFLFYISTAFGAHGFENYLVKYDIVGQKEEDVVLPKGFTIDEIKSIGNRLKCSGIKNQHIEIVELKGNKFIETNYAQLGREIKLEDFFFDENANYLLCENPKKVINACFIYRTDNEGYNGEFTRPSIGLLFNKPFGFFTDSRISNLLLYQNTTLEELWKITWEKK